MSASAAVRSLLAALALLLLLGIGCGGGTPEASTPAAKGPAARGRSLILVSLDTLRADRLGCYGYSRPTSPFLDRIASEGVRFAACQAPSSKTATSHMSMLSGMNPGVHGVRNYYGKEARAANAELPLLPELFQRAGYQTAAFTGGGMLSRELGFARGFETYDDAGGGADLEFPKAARWLEQHAKADKPFFLFVHTYQIHDPYTPPQEWQQRFVDPSYTGKIDSTRVPLPPDAAEQWKRDPAFYEAIQKRFWGGFDGNRAEDIRRMSDLYDAGIAFTDAELAKLWSTVERLGLADEVLLVITSDHGEEFIEHGHMTHNAVYQEILHVPLIVRLPKRAEAGRVATRPVAGADLMPSLAEAFDLALPVEVQGRSWVGDLSGELRPWDPVWSELGSPANEKAALRVGRYKLIGDRTRKSKAELFDLGIDAAEKFNQLENFEPWAVHLSKLMEQQEHANALLAPRYPPVGVEMGASSLGAMKALGYTGAGGK